LPVAKGHDNGVHGLSGQCGLNGFKVDIRSGGYLGRFAGRENRRHAALDRIPHGFDGHGIQAERRAVNNKNKGMGEERGHGRGFMQPAQA